MKKTIITTILLSTLSFALAALDYDGNEVYAHQYDFNRNRGYQVTKDATGEFMFYPVDYFCNKEDKSWKITFSDSNTIVKERVNKVTWSELYRTPNTDGTFKVVGDCLVNLLSSTSTLKAPTPIQNSVRVENPTPIVTTIQPISEPIVQQTQVYQPIVQQPVETVVYQPINPTVAGSSPTTTLIKNTLKIITETESFNQPPFLKTAKLGNKSDEIRRLQEFLEVTPSTGYFGVLTRAAVRNYQKENNLKVTGQFDKATLEFVNKELAN